MRSIRGIRILFEDDAVIVLEKSAGVLACGTRRGEGYSVESALADYVRKGQRKSSKCVFLVHRLDRDTSGVMMVAKTPDVQEYFRSRWNEITEKRYLARVVGRMECERGVFESYLAEDARTLKVRSVAPSAEGAKFARTEWRVLPDPLAGLRSYAGTSLVEARLHTGRKNQIRVHFAEAGHPVFGDSKYCPPGMEMPRAARQGGRLCLHALSLAFVHPLTGERMEFSTPAPGFAAPAAPRGTGSGGKARKVSGHGHERSWRTSS